MQQRDMTSRSGKACTSRREDQDDHAERGEESDGFFRQSLLGLSLFKPPEVRFLCLLDFHVSEMHPDSP